MGRRGGIGGGWQVVHPKVRKQGWDDSIKPFSIQPHL